MLAEGVGVREDWEGRGEEGSRSGFAMGIVGGQGHGGTAGRRGLEKWKGGG